MDRPTSLQNAADKIADILAAQDEGLSKDARLARLAALEKIASRVRERHGIASKSERTRSTGAKQAEFHMHA